MRHSALIGKHWSTFACFDDRFGEGAVTLVMVFMVVLLVTLRPQILPSWTSIFVHGKSIKSSAAAIAACLLLFVVPKHIQREAMDRARLSYEPILSWKKCERKMKWGVIILVCGGTTLAKASEQSGLSQILADALLKLGALPHMLIVLILCFTASVCTQITSNAAVSAFLVPVVVKMALALRVNPLYFGIPVTVSCSFAFILPAATPSNAVVFEAANIRTADMAKSGIILTLLCVTTEVVMINTLGIYVFNIREFPDWLPMTTIEPSNKTAQNAVIKEILGLPILQLN